MKARLTQDWREFFEALLAARVEFVVVGALAVAAHAEPRYTDDLDILVRPSVANGRKLKRAFETFGLGDVAPEPSELTDLDRVWMLGREPFRIDILTSIDGVSWPEIWRGRFEVELDGLVLPVLGLHELIANKRAAGRPKDLLDLISIARVTGVSTEAPQNATAKPKPKINAKAKAKRGRR